MNINQEVELPPTHPNIVNLANSTTIDFRLRSQKVMENNTYVSSVPYDLEILGDHQGVVMDINMSSLLGIDTVDKEIRSRKLVMSDLKAVTNYLTEVEDKFYKQNIFHRTRKLLRRVNSGHTDIAGIMCTYEKIDRDVYGICTKAEKSCRPTRAGSCDWSPKLANGIR